MKKAVKIIEGAQNWQIYQQKNGFAHISLKGTIYGADKKMIPSVYVRIVLEDTGETVSHWQPAQLKSDGNWEICLSQIPMGGLYRIETCMKETPETPYEWAFRGDMRHHIGVGELFVIAGQSNASGYGKDTITDPPELGIHMLCNSDRWELATHPLNDSTDSCRPANIEDANSGHSPYLSFARMVKKFRNCPIGLIPCALGGTYLSDWDPNGGPLYANMVERVRLSGGNIRAVLWYQGCADARVELSKTYAERFLKMVRNFRKTFGKEIPFFTCQLNRVVGEASYLDDESWTEIREAQRKSAAEAPEIYLVPTLDGTLSDSIHNSAAFNLVIGERLARQVLSAIWKYPIPSQAPDLIRATLNQNNQLELTFSPVYDYLYCYDIKPEDLPFSVKDQKGWIAISSYYQKAPDTLILQLSRHPLSEYTLYHAWGKDPKRQMVIDFGTHYPILGFTRRLKS